MSETLQEIGKKHGTDKHNDVHSYGGETYLNIYHRYMNELRDKPLKVLEIGVKDGNSHRMWREYFPKATIYGIDIDPRCKQYESDRIRVFIGSQSDPSTIDVAVKHAGGQFDIILDDGSHVNELTLKSFHLLFPALRDGGLYIIEDLGCSYLGEKLIRHIREGGWPGMQYNQGVSFNNERSVMDKFFNSLIHDIDQVIQHLEWDPVPGGKSGVEWVHFYSQIAVIKKLSRF
jgi:cephalosporin hydroxylase